MKNIADYHIHTKLCGHASGEMEDYVQEALKKGFGEFGFSDHAPAEEGYDPSHRMNLSRFPEYIENIQDLRDKFTNVNIRIGIEADIYPGFESFLEKLVQQFSVDYVIGSVHYIDELPVFLRELPSFTKREERQLIRNYFALVERGIRSGLINVLGHLDLIKWIFPESTEEILDAGSKVLETVSKNGPVLELNTSGMRKAPREVYPNPAFLKFASMLDIPICLGSDAHRPEEIGADFDNAFSLLEEIGYRCKGLSENGLKVFCNSLV